MLRDAKCARVAADDAGECSEDGGCEDGGPDDGELDLVFRVLDVGAVGRWVSVLGLERMGRIYLYCWNSMGMTGGAPVSSIVALPLVYGVSSFGLSWVFDTAGRRYRREGKKARSERAITQLVGRSRAQHKWGSEQN